MASEGFRQKTPEELVAQVQKVNEILGVPVTPRSWETLSKDEIKESHKVRYEAYLAVLRESKQEIKDEEVVARAREHVTMLNNLEAFIGSHEESVGGGRDERHASVYQDLQSFIEAGKTKGYVKLPTGVGKTVIFARLIEALGLKTLVVVPTKVLVNQTGQRFEEFTDIEFGKLYSEQKDTGSHVTVTTYASLVRNIKNGTLDPTNIPLLILDEAHRALGEETVKLLREFQGLQLGFTATDVYSKDKNVAEILPECIHSMSLSEAIQEGSLATTQTIHAFTEVDLSSVTVSKDGYNQAELEKAVNVAGRNKAAVELYQKAFSGRKAVCYCSGIGHANTLAKLFNKSGVPSAVITKDTTEESKDGIMGRKEIFEKFKSGEILVLCNARVLIEGFDEDTCSVGFNLHPTRSLVEAEQRGGRPGRLNANDPGKVSTIVDFIDKNAKRKSVLFSEILGGAYVVQKSERKKVGNFTDKTTTTKRIEKNSELLKLISVEGLRVSVDSQEILTVTREYKESREKMESDFISKKDVPEKKDDWWTAGPLGKICKKGHLTISKYADTFRESNPEWFEEQRTGPQTAEHYSPELVEKIVNYFKVTLQKKNGWETPRSLVESNKSSVHTIRNYAEEFRKLHPKWFEVQSIKPHNTEHYSPELVALIVENFGKISKKKAGWESYISLAVNCKKSINLIKNYAEESRELHPEWFEAQRNGTRNIEHYSPELVEKIIQHFRRM